MEYSELLGKLYSELHEPKLLPQDLLENVNCENYISVSFSKNEDLTIGETKCYLQNGSTAEFIYTFKGEKLMRLEACYEGKITETIYDRETEISKLKKELNSQLNYSSVS